VDTDRQADQAWLLGVQRKLYQWSRANPDDAYRELWNWISDQRSLRCAWRRVAANRGARTPGVDGKTVASERAQADGKKRAQYARCYDRRTGRMVCLPIRYADDFVVLVAGSRQQVEAEKNALAEHLRKSLGLELSAEKTRITPIMESVEFLGHRVRLKWDPRWGYYTSLEIPKQKAADLRYRVKRLTGRSTTRWSLATLLRRLNPLLRGWGYAYRHCFRAHRVFSRIDWYVRDRIWRWLRRKYPDTGARKLCAQFLGFHHQRRQRIWQDGKQEQLLVDTIHVGRFRLAWLRTPDYATTSGEPDA
jgi:hypothetical protein